MCQPRARPVAEEAGPRQRARLDELRARWLRPPPARGPRGRWLVLASPGDAGARGLRSGVAAAGRDLGLPLLWAPRGGEIRGEEGVAVAVVDLGVVGGRELAGLPGGAPGCDLLLWGGAAPGEGLPFQLYLLACLASRLLPRQLACAGGESVDERAELALSGRLQQLGVGAELRTGLRGDARQRVRHCLGGMLRRGVAAGLLLLLLLPAGARAQDAAPRPALVELVVGGLVPARARAYGGERLWSASRYSVYIGRGQGTWNADSTRVHLVLPREELGLWLDERPLPWRDERQRIDGRLQLLGPRLAIVAQSGELVIAGNQLELTLDGGPTPRDQRQGWALALGLGIVILLLLWRGSVARRQLAEPRTPIRSRERR